MEYDRLCEEILRIDPKVRFAGVCDETGEIKHGGHREAMRSLLTPEESKRSLVWAIAGWRLNNSLAPKIGKGKYVMTEHEKVKRITMTLDESHFLLISTEVDADHTKIIDSVIWLKERLR